MLLYNWLIRNTVTELQNLQKKILLTDAFESTRRGQVIHASKQQLRRREQSAVSAMTEPAIARRRHRPDQECNYCRVMTGPGIAVNK